MREVKPINELNVSIGEGDEKKNYVIHRAEMLKDEKISISLTSVEAVMEEYVRAEYEFRKLLHAQKSMTDELHRMVFEYTNKKYGPAPVEASDLPHIPSKKQTPAKKAPKDNG